MPTYPLEACPGCGAQDINIKFDGSAYCNGCGKVLTPKRGEKSQATGNKPNAPPPPPLAISKVTVRPGEIAQVGLLDEGMIFEYEGQRFMVVHPVTTGKVTGQKLNKKPFCGDTWIRGGTVSFQPDVMVLAK